MNGPAADLHDPRRVLIVDDHDGYVDALTIVLGAHPSVVVVGRAADGVAGLERARALRPDAIIMDVNMPRLDGFEATRRIRAELPFIRVLIVSGSPEPEHRDRANDVGAAAYLPKDATVAELADAIVTQPLRPTTVAFAVAS